MQICLWSLLNMVKKTFRLCSWHAEDIQYHVSIIRVVKKISTKLTNRVSSATINISKQSLQFFKRNCHLDLLELVVNTLTTLKCSVKLLLWNSNQSLWKITLKKGWWWMMMMMNCFCCMVDRRKAFSLISSRNHCQRSWPSQISDTPRAGFEPAQNLNSGLV